MNRKKIFTAALALLLLLSLLPAASAEEPSLLDRDAGRDLNFSLRSFVDEDRGVFDIAGNEFALEKLLFIEDAVIGEKMNVCLCEVSELLAAAQNTDALVMDKNALPLGCKLELRREKAHAVDTRNAAEILKEEKDGKKPDAEQPAAVQGDRDAWYLYLTGKPKQAETCLFVIIPSAEELFLCSVKIVDSAESSAYAEDWGTISGTPEALTPAQQEEESVYVPEWPDGKPDFPVPLTPPDQFEDNEVYWLGESAPDDWEQSTYNAEPTVTQPPVTAPPVTPQPITQTPVTPPPVTQPPVTQPPVTQPPVTIPTPTVRVTGATQYSTGEIGTLEALVNNAFNATYQWYTSLGSYSAPIQGATGSQYRPDTSRAGTYTYFCEVTSSGYGQAITVTSDPVTVTVAERQKQISSVSIASLPTNRSYFDGDTIDTAGLSLRVRYSDGSYDVVSSGFTVNPAKVSYNNAGSANVTVNYKGYQTTYQVEVHSYTELIRGIGVLSMPNKTSYTVGEYLNTAGLTIRVYSYDGRYLDISEGFECSPTYLSAVGSQTITVSFSGKTCTFSVNVEQARRVNSIAIQNLPVNRSYTVGDTVNITGLSLQVWTNTGYETVTSGYTYTPRVVTTPGTQTITVIYEGQSATFNVDVRESTAPVRTTSTPVPTYAPPSNTAAPGTTQMPYEAFFGSSSPAPSPTASAAPTATATPAPTYTPAPARKNTGVNSLVKILFGVAVLALCGLIGYVLYLRKRGFEEEEDYTNPDNRSGEHLHEPFDQYRKDDRNRKK